MDHIALTFTITMLLGVLVAAIAAMYSTCANSADAVAHVEPVRTCRTPYAVPRTYMVRGVMMHNSPTQRTLPYAVLHSLTHAYTAILKLTETFTTVPHAQLPTRPRTVPHTVPTLAEVAHGIAHGSLDGTRYYSDNRWAHTAYSVVPSYRHLPMSLVEAHTVDGIVDCATLDAVCGQAFGVSTLGEWYRNRHAASVLAVVPPMYRPTVRAYRAKVSACGGAGTVWAQA